MPHLRRWTSVAGAMALLLNIGCYSFQRPATSVPPVGETVRMKLTPEGTTELARYLGPRVVGVEGILSSTRPDGALVVAVEMVQVADGQRQRWAGEGQVTFPRDMVVDLERQVLDRRKSWLTAIAVAGAAVLVAVAAMHAAGAHTTDQPGVGGPATP